MKTVKGRPSPRNPGLSDFSSEWFELKLIRWRITWCHQKSKYCQLNAYLSHFKIVEIAYRYRLIPRIELIKMNRLRFGLIFLLLIIYLTNLGTSPIETTRSRFKIIFKIIFQLKWIWKGSWKERGVGNTVELESFTWN